MGGFGFGFFLFVISTHHRPDTAVLRCSFVKLHVSLAKFF